MTQLCICSFYPSEQVQQEVQNLAEDFELEEIKLIYY